MKTYNNLYDKICSFENLLDAFYKAKRGKRNTRYVGNFEFELENELLKLRSELLSETYVPQPLHRFVIRDPKTRVIHAPAFRDRVVHHAICNVLEPIFERSFVYDSYASRKNKGTHAALERFDEFKRKVSRNGSLVPYAKNSNMIKGYVMKADIKHYFPSVNHKILLKLISRKIKDEKVLSLLNLIIKSYGTSENNGMPLGALTSQLFANVYLNPLDHFIKETLRAKFYLRYLDDFVILHNSKQQLEEWHLQIETFLRNELKLELHSEKTKIFPLHRGVNLLGFRCFYYYRLLKKSSVRDILSKLQFAEGDERTKSLEGWLAHAEWANTYKARKEVSETFLRD